MRRNHPASPGELSETLFFSSFVHFEILLAHGIGRAIPEATIFTKRAELHLARIHWHSYPYVAMAIVHPHNLRNPDAAIQRPYGVRITLKPSDPFRKLLGADWNKTHWFGSAAERDAALIEMARKHEYSRSGDRPALKFDKVEKLHESRGL
jgi:hypothetical protein